MDIQFYNGMTQVGTLVTGVNQVTVKHNANMFYLVLNGQKVAIDCIAAQSVAANESLRIEADGRGDGVWWNVEAANMTYKDHNVSGVPESSAKWEKSATTHLLDLDVTGPSEVSHEVFWDFTGPSHPPKPLKVVIKRRS